MVTGITPSTLQRIRPVDTFICWHCLKQLYHNYDPEKKTAQWACTKEQQVEGPHAGWPCSEEDRTVSVSVVMLAQVPEGDVTRIFLVASAKPAKDSMGFDCHACAPAIGAAVFVWQVQRWVLESANAAIGFWGGWGGPPQVDFIAIGPQKHGLLLSLDNEGQGFSSSFKVLLMPIGKGVEWVWSIEDENDDLDAYDPSDKLNKLVPYRSSAALRFFARDGITTHTSDYYDIEVISRGSDQEDYNHPVKQENWTEIYTYRDGKYRPTRRTVFTEVKTPGKTPPQ